MTLALLGNPGGARPEGRAAAGVGPDRFVTLRHGETTRLEEGGRWVRR